MRISTVCIALMLGATAGLAGAAVPSDPNKVMPIEVGAKAPAFVAREVDSQPFTFEPGRLTKPVLVIFYRGGWCPYCNAHLKDLRTVEPEILKLGYEVLFLSTDKPALLFQSLKEKVPYHILSDSTMEAARAFGVAYRLDDATLKMMQTYGIDLDTTQGTSNHELPVPSVFIVDRAGVVRFRHFNADYKVRLGATEVLAAARKALHQ